MMRYVIVCLLSDEALKFHENLVQDVCSKFKVRPQRLPGHFTLKAPFELNDIRGLENSLENFVQNNKKEEMFISGMGKFRTDVVFMKTLPSPSALKLYDDLIDELKKLPDLTWRKNDGKDRTFHCTIVTKIKEDKFSDIWEYVSKLDPKFSIYFDNISILKWETDKWVTHKKYQLK